MKVDEGLFSKIGSKNRIGDSEWERRSKSELSQDTFTR
jgi:hypothetical protein